MRISDWSSDVCSSDLAADPRAWATPVNERGLRVRFLQLSGSAASIQQDRLGKCSLASVAAAHWRAVAPSQHNTTRATATAFKLPETASCDRSLRAAHKGIVRPHLIPLPR